MHARRTAVDRARRQSVLARLSVAWAAALIFGLVAGAVASAATSQSARSPHTGSSAARTRHRHRRASHIRTAARHRVLRTAAASAAPVVFGIYPGGAAGTVGPSGPVAPEDPAKRLAALELLRAPGAPFVLHIYAGYTGPVGWTAAQQVGDQIAQYTAAGFQVELVLTYRPADGGSSQDVSGFEEFVRQTITSFGSNPGFVSLQVTNEANVTGTPNASDGYYAGAEEALIGGVIAAKAAIRARGFNQVSVGFNWAYGGNVNEHAFWSFLGRKGGAGFVSALDWVGLDIYPGTWGPPLSGSLSSGTTAAMKTALTELRSVYLPLAGIPFRVPLHVSESGYPTGPGRTPAMQVQAMDAAVGAVVAGQSTFNITGYRWFDLRDAISASSDFESQYGLMTDAYVPKPAFFTYQALVARFGRRS
ncbi:MAG TPA: hypothetical protein VG371_17515 [Solirubrobacteraceae bacterium]|jgi:hypothetical protein|nr:hypothetical protein [Solirubrobacteraceae bacterium]